MDPVEAALQGLEQTLAAHLEYVLGAASACPPAGSPAWDGVLSTYRVTPPDIPDRAARISLHRGARGALPEEVRPVLEAAVCMAQRTLALLGQTWGAHLAAAPTMAQRAAALRARLAGLVDEKMRDYAARLQPEAGGSVSAIFANVAATAELAPWADVQWKRAMPLSCTGCGAPQSTPLDFVCAHCGSPLGGRPA